jgi:hypothetical protein
MEPLHAFLPITCRHCQALLPRLSLSANKDILVCPVCLRAGGFDDVLEEGTEPSGSHAVSDEARTLACKPWAQRMAHETRATFRYSSGRLRGQHETCATMRPLLFNSLSGTARAL